MRRIVDVGKIEYVHQGQIVTRYFLNGAGIGFDAAVCKRTTKLKKSMVATLGFIFWL